MQFKKQPSSYSKKMNPMSNSHKQLQQQQQQQQQERKANLNNSYEIRENVSKTHDSYYLPEIQSTFTNQTLREIEEQERDIDDSLKSIKSQIQSPIKMRKSYSRMYSKNRSHPNGNVTLDSKSFTLPRDAFTVDNGGGGGDNDDDLDVSFFTNRYKQTNSLRGHPMSNDYTQFKLNQIKYSQPLNSSSSVGMVEMLSSMYDYDKHIQKVKRMLNEYDRYYDKNDALMPFLDYTQQESNYKGDRQMNKSLNRSQMRSNESDTRESFNYSNVSTRRAKNTSDFDSFEISELKPDPKRTQKKQIVRQPTEVSPLNVNKDIPKSPYDPVAGFIVFIDFVTNLDSSSHMSRIITCVHHPKMGLGEPSVLPIINCESYKTNGKLTTIALFSTKQPVPKCSPMPNLSLLIELQIAARDKSLSNENLLKTVAWTKIPLFDSENYLRHGNWKQQLLSLPILAETSLTQLKSKHKFGTSEIYYRLVNAKDTIEETNEPISPLYSKKYKYSIL